MPRPARYRWSASEGCWRTDAGGQAKRFWGIGPGESRAIAEAFAAYLAELAARDSAGPPTADTIMAAYLAAERGVSARTVETHRECLLKLATTDPDGRGPLGARKAEDVTPSVLAACQTAWTKQGLGPIRQRNLIVSARACWRWAFEAGKLASNSLARLKVPGRPARVDRYATRAEMAVLLRACWRHRPDLARIVRAAIWWGARPGELCRLKWSDVNEREGVARLTEHKTAKRTGRVRTLAPLPHWLMRRRRHPEYVFTDPKDRPWKSANQVADHLYKLRVELGLPRLTLYQLRHAKATDMIQRGGHPSVVAELLGTSAKMLETTYVQLRVEYLREEAARLGRRRKG